MERIRDVGQYKELLSWNKQRFGAVDKNCFLMTKAIDKYIAEARIYVEKYDNGLAIFIDEGRYYNLYYFWNPEAPFADFRKEKPVLIEEINSNGTRDDYLKKIEPAFERAGFHFFKHNLQLERNLKDAASAIEAQYNRAIERLESSHLQLINCESDEMLEASIALWESALDTTDIPLDHLTLKDDDRLLCAVNEAGKVIATNWWRNTNKSSEGRHTVTDPDYYRKGIASALLHAWCRDSAHKGILKVFTWVSDTNDRSLALFSKAGFGLNGKTSKQYILQ